MDFSGYEKKVTEQGAHTCWRRQREGLIRSQKESNRVRSTHSLETAEGGAHQNTERKRLNKGYSLSRDSRGRDISGHRKEATEQEALTS